MARHKHADLIIAWAEGAQIQEKAPAGNWVDVGTELRIGWWDTAEYRIKPREFIEGRWYPVISDGSKRISYFDGHHFWSVHRGSGAYESPGFLPSQLDWIGEPLPEINWPVELKHE